MHALRYLFLQLLVAVPVPDRPAPASSWVGKVVLGRTLGVKFVEMDDATRADESVTLTQTDHKVLGERHDRVQVKARNGATGWIEKKDVVLLDEAVVFFSDRLARNPTDTDALNRRARALYLQGEWDGAINDYTLSLKLRPSAALYNNRAIVWQKKDVERAIADYTEALRLSPQMTTALANRGALWRNQKEYRKAVDDLTAALRIEPRYVVAYLTRAGAYRGLKEWDQALADLNQLLELDPRNVQGWHDRAAVWAAKKEYARALADGEQALKVEPANGGALNGLAWLLATCPEAKFRDGRRAVALAEKAVAGQKQSSAFLSTLAAAHAECGDFDAAARWQEQALRDPGYARNEAARRRLELYRMKQPYREAEPQAP